MIDGNAAGTRWFDDYLDEADEGQIDEYDITATPNDFNVMTIVHFIESGAVKIPGFQRNYVWDLRRASKLVESLILGLPVPQVFLYEEDRNSYLVIDGQQRLMTLYYFAKQRFPRKDKRVELRRVFEEHGAIPEAVLHDDKFFSNFRLSLPEILPNRPNKFKGLSYSTLGDYKTQFELRPIRNVVVKQNHPAEDDSSVFEIFNRLNSGGVNLSPQEIRTSLYHSSFYDMLSRANLDARWRRLLRMDQPALHMKDVEILMRGFAMLIRGHQYAPSMTKFLNQFAKQCQRLDEETNHYLEGLFSSFLAAAEGLPDDAFLSKRTKRFNLALYEAVFTATCSEAFKVRRAIAGALNAEEIAALDSDEEFLEASQKATTQKANVETRLERARSIITAL